MKSARKTITFNRSISDQNEAFIFLEKIRYSQTRFITKLIQDFIHDNNIDLNGNYDDMRRFCEYYINSPLEKDSVSDRLTKIENLLMEIHEEQSKQLNILNESKGQFDPHNNLSEEDKNQDDINSTIKSEATDSSFDNMLSSFELMANQ